jgi:Skp family chaperone for outer membrane proteins
MDKPMHNSNLAKLGWVISAALGGLLLAGGFQGPTEKTGVVDINYLVKTSDYGSQALANLKQMQEARNGVLQFIVTNRVLTVAQAEKLKELSLKSPQSDADKAELLKLQADIKASKVKNDELALKSNPTPEEKTLMNDYGDRIRAMEQKVLEWDQAFTRELQDSVSKQQSATIDKARAAVKEVAKAQGYTIVFEAQVAPYGANDISDAALKAMNAKKN